MIGTRTKTNNLNQKAMEVERLQNIKMRTHRTLLEVLNLNEARKMPSERLFRECSSHVDNLLSEQGVSLSAAEKDELLRGVMDDIFGLGPIEAFLRAPDISDILINGPAQIYIERNGLLEHTNARFRDDAHVIQVIQRIAAQVGRRIDESSPMLDARLADGSRVNAIIPPLALDGPVMSIRRFGANPIDIDKLRSLGALTDEMIDFMRACVIARLNILIVGGTGSGKTTFLNVISKWIPAGERVITIEDAAELSLQREHVVRLETRPPNIEGRGDVTQGDLLRNSLRMRPDRIIIGEVRGAEALDMLQAMNTGHEGSMTTVHANTSRDGLARIENMVSMAGLGLPISAIRTQIHSAINIVVHLARLAGGKRCVTTIAEITGIEGDVICMQDIFQFRQSGIGTDGHAQGQFVACGVRPQVAERLLVAGIELPRKLFERRVLYVSSSQKEKEH